MGAAPSACWALSAGPDKPPIGGLYPHMFAMPSGRVLVGGPFPEDTWFLNPPGTANSFGWQDLPATARDRLWGTGVLMPGGAGGSTRVMQLGGSAPATSTPTTTDIAVATTEIFDEANPGLGWRSAPSMQVGRGHHNTVLLPDGSMVTVGGGVGIRNGDQWAADPAQRQVDLWNPATSNWTLGAEQAEARAYHSTALLLPDGRVISAGDDVNGGTDRDSAEIYEPPYLFKGARPTITKAPTNVKFGTPFDVGSPNTNIAKATLVAPGATTHANDMNQRYIPLTVAQRAGGVTLTAPATADIATPGYYMLFLLNGQGVPSVAKFVRLGNDTDPPPIFKPAKRPLIVRGCVNADAAVKKKRMGPVRLGRTRKAQRKIFKGGKRRTRGGLDRYCVAGGGALKIGYPTTKLGRRLKPSLRRKVNKRVVLILTSSRRFSLKGIHAGDSPRSARRQLKGERRFQSGANTWYVTKLNGSRLLVKTRGGRVREIGIGHTSLSRSRQATKYFLTSWRL